MLRAAKSERLPLALRTLPSDNAVHAKRGADPPIAQIREGQWLVFSVASRRGKGSHVLVCVGSRRSFVPSSRDLPAGTRRAILRQLGVSPSDLERIRPPPQPRQV